MSDMAISFTVLGAVVILFVWNRLPVEVVALGAGLTLYATGVLTLDQVLGGFGDPTVVFIATLFVVSEGLDASGVTAWAGQELVARVGTSRTRLMVLMMLLVAGLTALISVNGAVAALLPMVVVMALRLGRAPSQLLLPLAFAAHAGSMLALTGSPVNVIVSEAAHDATGHGFGFFSFALLGVPMLIGTIAIVVWFGSRLLPERQPDVLPPDLSDHARTLVEHYTLREGVARLQVERQSGLVGETLLAVERGDHPGVLVVGAQRGRRALTDPSTPLAADDLLIVHGEDGDVERFAARHSLTPAAGPQASEPDSLITRSYGVAEVVIAPRSAAIGRRITPGMVTSGGDLVVLAVERKGEDQGPQGAVLAEGDTLLLRGAWDALDRKLERDPDVLTVDAPDMIRRQAVPLGPRSTQAIAILAAMVLLLATGAVQPAVAGLLAAGAMVLSRVVPLERAYRSISWTTVILVGAMIPISQAMQQTGAAERIATGLVDVVGNSSPYLLAAGLFVVTAVLGQLISNMATALIVIPIAVSAAVETGVSGRPLLMTVNVACSAAFLTPVATPVNMMVMAPAGYRFGDYWKLGLPLLALYFVIAVFLVPVFWSF
jgi:di/tricarboxylate transporter